MHSIRGAILLFHYTFIDKECWYDFDSQRLGAGLIGLETLPDFVALHVFSKLVEIESERFRVGINSSPGSVALLQTACSRNNMSCISQ